MVALKLQSSVLIFSASLMLYAPLTNAQQSAGTTHFQELSSSLDNAQSAETPEDTVPPSPWQRANFHPPLYPKSMALNGIEGCAVYQTTISDKGNVESLSVIRSVPDNLEKAALLQSAELLKWQLPPGTEPAEEVKEFRINFCMADSERAAKARCEQFAALPCS